MSEVTSNEELRDETSRGDELRGERESRVRVRASKNFDR